MSKLIYQVNEQVSNYSVVAGTFETEEKALEYIDDTVTERTNEAHNDNDDTEFNYSNEYQLQSSYFNVTAEELDLYTQIVEGEESKNYGEDIINSFYSGNFSYGAEQLREINITAIEFGDYIQELCEDLGYDNMTEFANNHFDYNFFICLGKEAL